MVINVRNNSPKAYMSPNICIQLNSIVNTWDPGIHILYFTRLYDVCNATIILLEPAILFDKKNLVQETFWSVRLLAQD